MSFDAPCFLVPRDCEACAVDEPHDDAHADDGRVLLPVEARALGPTDLSYLLRTKPDLWSVAVAERARGGQ